MRVHLFGGGIDEIREYPGDFAPTYIEVNRVKTPSTIFITEPATEPIIEKLVFKHVKTNLVNNLYLLEEEKQ